VFSDLFRDHEAHVLEVFRIPEDRKVTAIYDIEGEVSPQVAL
jgi:hypothetical protein